MSLGGTDLNLMVALKALLEEGNVTKAGAKIGKSQPAMSTALARLRRHYQDELLVRVGRDYELTPFAKALVPSVQQTLQCVELALDTGRRFDPATSGTRSASTPPTTSSPCSPSRCCAGWPSSRRASGSTSTRSPRTCTSPSTGCGTATR